MRPFGSNILVLEDDSETKTTTGLILTNGQDSNLHRGTVVAVGEGDFLQHANHLRPMRIKEGDKIAFSNFATTESITDSKGQKLLVMPEHEVRVILE